MALADTTALAGTGAQADPTLPERAVRDGGAHRQLERGVTAPKFDLHHVFADRLPELSRAAQPARASTPRIIALNESLAVELGLDARWLRSPSAVRVLAGAEFPAGAQPVAQAYAGHQWGVFKPVLGDGRAFLLGELRGRDGVWRDLHLKGIGPTEFSRVDGYALVAPMLREYLMGEAMRALGVPTTRALAVVATGDAHTRDHRAQPGAVLARVARSHLRIGSFQYVPALGDVGLLRRVADFAIDTLYPDDAAAEHPYRALFTSVIDAHARLTAHWMRLGFVHGVLSTDNVTISGETIDYGPCAFVDRYDPDVWYSSIDEHGRYAYSRQPAIMEWNLARLGDAMAPLLGDSREEAAEFVRGALQRYRDGYERHHFEAFRDKLGVDETVAAADPALIRGLIDDALGLLALHQVDFTGFFRDLVEAAAGDDAAVRSRFGNGVLATAGIDAWLARWRALRPSAERVRSVNPLYIPRNQVLDAALEAAAAGDLGPFHTLLGLVTHPYEQRPGVDSAYTEPGPEGVAHRTFCGT